MTHWGYQLEAFESEIFAAPVVRLTWGGGEAAAPKSLSEIVGEWRRGGVWLASCRIGGDGGEALELLTGAGFRPVETLLTFRRPLGKPPEGAPTVTLAGPGDREDCLAIGRAAFTFDRFHADPEISDSAADRVKEKWVANALNGRADAVLVSRDGGRTTGFNLCLLAAGEAIIDLIAIAPDRQGQGLGRRLVAAALDHYRGRAETIAAGTQLANQPSIKLYTAMGFKEYERQVTLHWINRDVRPA